MLFYRGIRDEVLRPAPAIPPPRELLPSGLQQLYDTRPHSDVVIIAACNVEVKAHKAILVSRSPVFAAMLSHNLSEKRTNKIELKDTPQEVLVS